MDSNSRSIMSGCGSDILNQLFTLNIATTTGGNFSVQIESQISIENLKKIIAKKLKVAKDRICLLHRERELLDGTAKENGLFDGAKVILIPNVETGLLTQRPENTVMQALESLNDSQVNDFLSGKTPLNLSMRLGDHMMLIQLQLSTVNPASPQGGSRSRSNQKNSNRSSSYASTSFSSNDGQLHSSTKKLNNDTNVKIRENSINIENCLGLSNGSQKKDSATDNISQSVERNSYLSKQDFDNLKNIVKGLSSTAQTANTSFTSEDSGNSCCSSSLNSTFSNDNLEQSPIKSLSNLVSSPIKTASLKSIPISKDFPRETNATNRSTVCHDPISAKLTSCLCKRLDSGKLCETNQCPARQEIPNCTSEGSIVTTNTSSTKFNSSPNLHKTANNTIGRIKHRHHLHHHNNSISNTFRRNVCMEKSCVERETSSASTSTSINSDKSSSTESLFDIEEPMAVISATDSRALAEASRNLTQTLRKLSKEVFTNKVDLTEEIPRKSSSGAVIESMKNHGKGIYSGTFSGTLNPALQDRYGRPKRDISTVIHILNDLLSATPQYSRGARISFEPSRVSKQNGSSQTEIVSHESSMKCVNSKGDACNYGECNGHYSNSDFLGQTTGSDRTISCNDRNISCGCSNLNSSSINTNRSGEGQSLTCSFHSFNTSPNSHTQNTNETICNKCSIELENNKTKFKLDQLRLVMQQRKQKREARKLKGAPYGAVGRVVGTTSNNSPNGNNNTTTSTIAPLTSPSEVSANHIVEEVDTAA